MHNTTASITIFQRSELRNKYQQCRQITKIKSSNQYVMAQGRVVSTKETDGPLRTPQLKVTVYAKAATLTANDCYMG